MKQLISIAFLFILLTSGKKPDVKKGTITLFNDQVEISVPAGFNNLNDAEIKKFYSTETLPKIVLTNDFQEIRIAFNTLSLSSKESGIPILTAKFEAA